MMFHNPLRDFFVSATTHAKQNRMSELNYMEAELIMLEEDLLRMQRQGFADKKVITLSSQISELKKIVVNKKKEL
jgi:hypothetical protein